MSTCVVYACILMEVITKWNLLWLPHTILKCFNRPSWENSSDLNFVCICGHLCASLDYLLHSTRYLITFKGIL